MGPKSRDLLRAVGIDREIQKPGAALHDRLKLVHLIKAEPHRNPEAVAQRRRQQAGARRRADQREAG